MRIFHVARSVLLLSFLSCVCLLSLAGTVFTAERPPAEQYLQYVPESLEAGEAPRDDGVLVKRIRIRRGDTLARLSRQYSGKAHYYPQILLFNRIANPDLIHAGREIRVPVTLPSVRKGGAGGKSTGKPRRIEKDAPSTVAPLSAGKEEEALGREQAFYQQAVALFVGGRYREAIAAFTGFLEKYPRSPMAPDARLYRADCYLRLSEQ